jgi:glycosyltransferase involved in cell wall biosynthesis
MVHVTVAIPTYNGEKRLPDVLDRLRSQIDTESFSWEVLVVDNNSTDNTAQLVREYQKTWPATYPLKYCFAPEQGAAFARQRAIEKASGELVGFLDDDNLPENNWVVSAYNFAQTHPDVGAYGSQIHADFLNKNKMMSYQIILIKLLVFWPLSKEVKPPIYTTTRIKYYLRARV